MRYLITIIACSLSVAFAQDGTKQIAKKRADYILSYDTLLHIGATISTK